MTDDPFANLDDDLNVFPDGVEPRGKFDRLSQANGGDRPVHEEVCQKCRGTGRFISYSGRSLGECFACKGAGKKTFKTSAPERAKARDNAAARKARDEQTLLDAFKAEHPTVWAWMDGSTFEFAVKMREAVIKWGGLTERQLLACYGCVDKLEAAKAARQDRNADVDLSAIDKAFAAAKANGAKKSALRFDGMTISLAPAHGVNAGALYVKDGERYLGKVREGRFQAARECTDADRAKLVDIAADPLTKAVEYGKRFSSCSCCGLTLTNKVSIDLGIGPICREKFGW